MGEGFDKKIYDSYKNFSNDSIVRLSKLRGKIQLFSIGIIETLQRIIDKQPLILKTEDEIPFTENACCHDDNGLNTYEYFASLDPTIELYNEQVIKYKAILQKHLYICVAPSLISLLNTRKEKVERSYIFSESTIYLSFIKYCDFNTGIQLNEQLKQICDKNISEIKKLDTIEDKIDILKSEGHRWNDESQRQLLLYISKKDVSRQNNVEPDSSFVLDKAKKTSSVRSIFESWVEASKNAEISPLKLQELLPVMEKLYDTFDITQSSKETGDGKEIDFIEEVILRVTHDNKKMGSEIIKKLKNIPNTKNTIKFLEEIHEFYERGEGLFMSKSDETHYSLTQMIKNMIKDMLITFPHLIKNETNRFSKNKIKLPLHWGFGSKKFSPDHINRIKNAIIPLSNLEKYSCDENCKIVIKMVLEKGKDIIQFINCLPFLSDIENNKTIFNGKINSVIIIFIFYATIGLYYDVVDEIIEKKYDKSDPNQESEMYGDMEEYNIMISNILNTYLHIFKDTKKSINKNPETIKNNVLKEKEIEKENLKDQFNLLDDEHRKIEREKKNLKLGKWNVGLSKAIFQYDPEQYDKEIRQEERLNQMLEQNNIELSAGEQNNSNNMFSQISGAATDLLVQQQSEQDIHNEMYGLMDEMGDDEDFDDGNDELY